MASSAVGEAGNCVSGLAQVIGNVVAGNAVLRAGLEVQKFSKIIWTSYVLNQQTQFSQDAIKAALPSLGGSALGSAINGVFGNPPPSPESAITQAAAAVAMLAAGAAGAAALPEAAAIAAGIGVGLSIADFINSGAFSDCAQSAISLVAAIVGALDPNDKTGSRGALGGHWVLGSQPVYYDVSFENEPTATAPAQQIVVTDQLNPNKVKLKTLQLGPMGFGSTVVTPPSGSTSYSTIVDMGAVASVADLKVDIQGSLDPTTRLLKWTFRSIDASTGLPPDDPLAGLLPPNKAGVAPAGTGSVTFSVMPKGSLTNGAIVKNQATVVFGANASIKTPVWQNRIAEPVAGAFSFSPRPLNFGNRPVFGTSGPSPVKALTLANPGGVPILVGNIGTSSNFQLVNPQACVTLLNPGQSCTLQIRFAPTAVVAYNGKLTITDNSSSSPQTVALEGAGVPGTLSFTPDSLAFGKVKVNTTSVAKQLKMSNVTGAIASVMSVVPSLGFVTSNDLCTGATLTPNQSCTVDVAFNPTATGHVPGNLTVTTDSAKAQKVELSGNGVQ